MAFTHSSRSSSEEALNSNTLTGVWISNPNPEGGDFSDEPEVTLYPFSDVPRTISPLGNASYYYNTNIIYLIKMQNHYNMKLFNH